MRLQNRVAIVTGAQQGIGEAIVRAFAREGAKVVLNYLDDRDRAEAIAAETGASLVQGDVAAMSDIARMIEVATRLGGVDLLVNNAGIFPRADFLELDPAEWDLVLGVNLKGPFLCTQAAAKDMVARSVRGAVINIASIIAKTGAPEGVHYSASKSGLVGLTRATALALAPHGIRVNALAPGLTDTAQPRYGMTEEEIAEAVAAYPLGQLLSPAEIADAAVFLASDESRQMTGQTIHVNGGQVLV